MSRDRSWRSGPGLGAERWAQSGGPAGTGRGFEEGVSRKKLGEAPPEPWRVVGLGAEIGVDLKQGGPGRAELEGRVGGVVWDQGRDLGGKAERGGCQVTPGALLYRLSRAFTEHHELEDSNLVDSLTCCTVSSARGYSHPNLICSGLSGVQTGLFVTEEHCHILRMTDVRASSHPKAAQACPGETGLALVGASFDSSLAYGCPSCIWLLISRSGVFPAAPGILGSNKLLPCCALARNINWRVCCEDTVCLSTPHITCHKITDTMQKLFSKLRTGGLQKEILKSHVSKTLTFCNILYQKSGKHKFFYFQGIKPSFCMHKFC